MNPPEIFEVVLDVDADGRADPRYAVAAVYAIVQAADDASALDVLERDLTDAGYTVLPSPRKATRIAADEWPRYIRERWPLVAAQLPTLDGLLSKLRTAPAVHLSFYPHD